MRLIKILEGCTEESVNKVLKQLQAEGNYLVNISITHPKENHYTTYATIVYENEK